MQFPANLYRWKRFWVPGFWVQRFGVRRLKVGPDSAPANDGGRGGPPYFRYSSVLCFLTSVLCFLTSVLCLLTSVICLPTSVFCFLYSVFCLLSSVFLLYCYPDVVRYTQLNLLPRRNQV
jgi:hypothetical protein